MATWLELGTLERPGRKVIVVEMIFSGAELLFPGIFWISLS